MAVRPEIRFYWKIGGKVAAVDREMDVFANGMFKFMADSLGMPRSALPGFKRVKGNLTMLPTREPVRATLILPMKDIENKIFKMIMDEVHPDDLKALRNAYFHKVASDMDERFKQAYNDIIKAYFKSKWPAEIPTGIRWGKEPGTSKGRQLREVDLEEATGDKRKDSNKGEATKGFKWADMIRDIESSKINELRNKYNLIRRKLLTPKMGETDSEVGVDYKIVGNELKLTFVAQNISELFTSPAFMMSSKTPRKSPYYGAFYILEFGTGSRAKPVVIPFSSPFKTPYKIPHSLGGGLRPGMWSNIITVARTAQTQAGYRFSSKSFETTQTAKKPLEVEYSKLNIMASRLARYGRHGIHSIFSPSGIQGYSTQFIMVRNKLFNRMKKEVTTVSKDAIKLVIKLIVDNRKRALKAIAEARGITSNSPEFKAAAKEIVALKEKLTKVMNSLNNKKIVIKVTVDNNKKRKAPKDQVVTVRAKNPPTKPAKKSV